MEMGLTKDQLGQIFNFIDTSDDGIIVKEELIRALVAAKKAYDAFRMQQRRDQERFGTVAKDIFGENLDDREEEIKEAPAAPVESPRM